MAVTGIMNDRMRHDVCRNARDGGPGRRIAPLLALAAAIAWGSAAAGGDAPPPPPPHGAAAAPGAPAGAEVEPQVTITSHGREIHKEYRVNGRLYMIEVIPAHGKPYYLIDATGDGVFLRRRTQPDIAVPMWVIKRF